MDQMRAADKLFDQGQLDEAMGMYRALLAELEDRGPEWMALQARIVRVLQRRGDLGESLTLLTEEVLPWFESAGDERGAASMRMKVGDILQAQGDFDGALRARREVLAVGEKIEDPRFVMFARTRLADTLAHRGRDEDGAEIVALLSWAHNYAQQHDDPAVHGIEGIYKRLGLAVPGQDPTTQRRRYESEVEAASTPEEVAFARFRLAQVLGGAGAFEEARTCAELGLAAAREAGRQDGVDAFTDLLAQLGPA